MKQGKVCDPHLSQPLVTVLADQLTRVDDCALPSHDTGGERPQEVTTAMDPAPREGGCWSWRTQRKMALEHLPPHLGPCKVQWMNSSLSIRFCSQGWPCSPFCNALVRVVGWRDVLGPFFSVPMEGTAPLPYCFTHCLSESH